MQPQNPPPSFPTTTITIGASYLTGRDDLERSQSSAEVGDVGLEVEESVSDRALQLGGALPRGAVGGDLVESGHVDDRWTDEAV